MHPHLDPAARKGRLSLSINQDLLNRLEPYKKQINLSAHAEQLLAHLLAQYENRSWAERNAQALEQHGQAIRSSGLAGSEFDRI